MTLEVGPTSTAVGAPATNDTAPGKSKPHGGHAAGAPTGFMAILAALAGSTGAGAGSDTGADPGQQNYLADTHAKAGHAGAKAGANAKGAHPAGVGADADLDAKTLMDEKAALAADSAAKALQTAGGAAQTPTGNADLGALSTDTAALLTQSAQWSATAVTAQAAGQPSADAASFKLPMASATDNYAGSKLARTQGKADEPAVAVTAAGETSLLATARAAKAQKDAAAGRQAAATADITTQASGTAQADPRNAQPAPKVADVPTTALAAALVTASEAAPPQRDSGARERTGYRASASDNASAPQTYAPTGTNATTQANADATSTTGSVVAEKVAYWISNDVQNAQMKLDGIGDKPVEVSIRMQGNEAHVAFRTDELQAQAALENASAHLKDMLQREGLVLSGVSVGSSGANGSGAMGDPQSGARQGGRHQATVVAAVQSPIAADRSSGAGRASGSAVDLFV